jgi:hypothetical protein
MACSGASITLINNTEQIKPEGHLMRFLFFTVLACIITVVTVNSSAHAAGITPFDVYQKTEVLRQTLEDGNLIDTENYEAEPDDKELRHPRHVIQKVRECHMMLSKILRAEGVSITPLPDLISVREVRPADVLSGVESLIKSANEIGIETKHDQPLTETQVPRDDVLPVDVYNNLKRICRSVKTQIEPSDVYRVAVAVNQNLDKVVASRGYTFETEYHVFENKVPADVYAETKKFLKDLRQLALNPDFSIPGGVVFSQDILKTDILPQDVMGLMNDAVSETQAIKYTLNIREHAEFPPYAGGMKPSDVFSQIERAHRAVKALLEREGIE